MYVRSEAILGRALSSGYIERDKATIATKMGEHWDATERVAHADHRFDRLLQSLDRSMELLGHIDLLQFHKANTTNIASADVLKALDRAAQMGIRTFGASVTNLELRRLHARQAVTSTYNFRHCDHTVYFIHPSSPRQHSGISALNSLIFVTTGDCAEDYLDYYS